MISVLAAVPAERLRSVCGEEPGTFCRLVLDWTGDRTSAELADNFLGKPLAILLILLGALVINKLVRRSMKGGLRRLHTGGMQESLGALRRATPDALLETQEHSMRTEQRVQALGSVLGSVASFGIFTIAGFMVLGRLGTDLGPLLAGAGVIGVALGFGSQSLVKDFLSGIFILIEDQFGVGDIISLDLQTEGTVEAVSLRTTRLRSVDGTVWHVPNGDIKRVGNRSQRWSRALLDIEVSYDTDLDLATEVIDRVAQEVAQGNSKVLDRPEVWGVESLGPNSVVIRLVVKTTPAAQYVISRQLLRKIKDAFDAEGIEIPFPQQTVWHRDAEQAPQEP